MTLNVFLLYKEILLLTEMHTIAAISLVSGTNSIACHHKIVLHHEKWGNEQHKRVCQNFKICASLPSSGMVQRNHLAIH